VLQDYRAPPLALYAIFPPTRHLSVKVRLFIEFLIERFELGRSLAAYKVGRMTNPDERPGPSHAEGHASPWIAFRYRAFTVVWTATVVANAGTWMYDAASGWLMTSLNPDPLTVSLVQVAGSLPMFLFALPAGALADTVDQSARRRSQPSLAMRIPSVEMTCAAREPFCGYH
jgi:hypothetical protein